MFRDSRDYPTGLPTGQPSALPTELPTGQPTAHPTGLPTAQPSAHPTDTSRLPKDDDDDDDTNELDAGAVAGIVVGVLIVILGVGYTIFHYRHNRGQHSDKGQAKVRPPEDTKGLASVVPEQRSFVEQRRMSEREGETEADLVHGIEGGQVPTMKTTTIQKTKAKTTTKKKTPKMNGKSKASEPV